MNYVVKYILHEIGRIINFHSQMVRLEYTATIMWEMKSINNIFKLNAVSQLFILNFQTPCPSGNKWNWVNHCSKSQHQHDNNYNIYMIIKILTCHMKL